MGGIVTRSEPNSRLSFPSPEHNYKVNFFAKKAKILSSKSVSKIHPDLVMLRIILQCEYGRPKLIQYLIRTTTIDDLLESGDHQIDQPFLLNDFKSQFHFYDLENLISEENSHHLHETQHSNFLLNLRPFLPQMVLLIVLSGYYRYLSTPEHTEWLRYQHLLTQSKNLQYISFRESMRSTSLPSSHRLALAIDNSNFLTLLNQSDWIVSLASMCDELPFPISIITKETEFLNPPSSTSSTLPTRSGRSVTRATSNSTSSSSAAVQRRVKLMILYTNQAFIDMVGESCESIAQYSLEKYHSPSHSSSSPSPPSPSSLALIDAIDSGMMLRIGTIFFPHTPLLPFMNLQSYLPLYDSDGICHSYLVLHCQLDKYSQHTEYLQKLHLLTECLSKVILPNRIYSNTFLRAYFYQKYSTTERKVD
jgi:hypothetical protein